ncbi:hypothetical protein E0H39_29665 [Rhizobium leguminosarum bv. viciae]|uniref:hypothetical protein n=1 Tax=Rhizobium leguminosarum TaxID=384 RepID=UPI00103D0904|nr:hypothetical protein [Rhizobium leguminosarum]TBY57986.1 hypothetical protein E0H39_29665 [Rhizobium leguminosarum bv. viciae]
MPATQRKPTNEKRHERGFSTRAFAGSPTSVDPETRSFDIVITTETPVRTWIPDPRITDVETQDCSYIEVDEVLLTEGLDYSRTPRMPLLDSHDSYSSIDKIAGKIEQVRAEGQSVIGRASLTSKRADILPDIADGFYGQCSAGYCVLEYEITERPDMVPLAVAKRWLLTEASLVAVGADPNSFIRSAGAPAAPKVIFHALPKSQERNMKNLKRGLGRKRADEGTSPDAPALDDVIAQAEDAVAAAEAAVDALDAAVSAAGDDAGDDVMERAAALRSRFRAAEDETDPDADKKPAEEDGTRADGDDEDMTEKEKEEVDAVRSIARSYGLTKLVDDMVKLGSRAAQIKTAVRSKIAGGANQSATPAAVVKPAQRAAAPTLNTAAIYAARNKR